MARRRRESPPVSRASHLALSPAIAREWREPDPAGASLPPAGADPRRRRAARDSPCGRRPRQRRAGCRGAVRSDGGGSTALRACRGPPAIPSPWRREPRACRAPRLGRREPTRAAPPPAAPPAQLETLQTSAAVLFARRLCRRNLMGGGIGGGPSRPPPKLVGLSPEEGRDIEILGRLLSLGPNVGGPAPPRAPRSRPRR